MKFLVVDDMKIIRDEECVLLKEVMPECQICACSSVSEALTFAGNQSH